jgi:hypothetical protein
MIHRRRERLVLLIYQLRLLCDICDRMTNDLRNITSEYKDYRYGGWVENDYENFLKQSSHGLYK